jgi:hypothetical protein
MYVLSAGEMVQVVEHLPSKHKPLNSNPVLPKCARSWALFQTYRIRDWGWVPVILSHPGVWEPLLCGVRWGDESGERSGDCSCKSLPCQQGANFRILNKLTLLDLWFICSLVVKVTRMHCRKLGGINRKSSIYYHWKITSVNIGCVFFMAFFWCTYACF